MASITRTVLAAQVSRRLDKLGDDLSTTPDGDQTEGDYTDAIDQALEDFGWSAITDADTLYEIRALRDRTEFRALERLYNKRAPVVDFGTSVSRGRGREEALNQVLLAITVRLDLLQQRYESDIARLGREPSGTGHRIAPSTVEIRGVIWPWETTEGLEDTESDVT